LITGGDKNGVGRVCCTNGDAYQVVNRPEDAILGSLIVLLQ